MIRRWLAGPLILLALLLLTLLPATPAAAEGGGPFISAAASAAAAPARTLRAPIAAPTLLAPATQGVLHPAVIPADGVHVALRPRPYDLPWALRSPPVHRRADHFARNQRPRIIPMATRAGEGTGRWRLPVRST
jgi:hypothetical protein